MKAEELTRLHEDYRRAVEASRNPESEEAAKAAADDMIALRHKLDAALIEAEQDREDEQRAAAVEARQEAARIVSGIVTPEKPAWVDELRAYGQSRRRGDVVSFFVPLAEPEKRADWTTTDTTTYSSYTVPQSWANEVYMKQIAMSGVLAAGPTILRTANGNQINYATVATEMTAAAGTEGSAATETNPVHGQVLLNSYRVDGWTPISDELFRDSGIDIEAHVRKLAARALATKAAPYYADIDIGTGSSLPSAITVNITNGKTCASTTAVSLTEAKELMYSVLPQYRQVGRWVGNSTVTLDFATTKDDNGNFVWNPSVAAGEPDTLFGKPYFEDSFMDASTTGNIPLIFGDVESSYLVRLVGGIEVSFSRDFAFTSFETTARFAMWHDAVLIDTIGVKAATLA